MKNLLYLSLLLPFILGSCHKNQYVCKEQDLVEAPPEFLQYWYFPKGSYWIYKLQDTVGVYDTMRVTSDYKRYCKGDDPHNPDCDQGNCIWMYSNTWEHSSDKYFRVMGCPTKGQQGLTTYYLGDYWAISGNTNCFSSYLPDFLLKYPFKVGEKYMGNNLIVSEDTLNVVAGMFPKTLEIIPDYGTAIDSIKAYYVKKLYICPNVGVIKWQYSQSGTWELVEYDVTP